MNIIDETNALIEVLHRDRCHTYQRYKICHRVCEIDENKPLCAKACEINGLKCSEDKRELGSECSCQGG